METQRAVARDYCLCRVPTLSGLGFPKLQSPNQPLPGIIFTSVNFLLPLCKFTENKNVKLYILL